VRDKAEGALQLPYRFKRGLSYGRGDEQRNRTEKTNEVLHNIRYTIALWKHIRK
jgi:hypothetical protein